MFPYARNYLLIQQKSSCKLKSFKYETYKWTVYQMLIQKELIRIKNCSYEFYPLKNRKGEKIFLDF